MYGTAPETSYGRPGQNIPVIETPGGPMLHMPQPGVPDEVPAEDIYRDAQDYVTSTLKSLNVDGYANPLDIAGLVKVYLTLGPDAVLAAINANPVFQQGWE